MNSYTHWRDRELMQEPPWENDEGYWNDDEDEEEEEDDDEEEGEDTE